MRIKFNLFFILFLFLSYCFGFMVQTMIIFFSVLLHELGHVYAARQMEIKVEEVELFPFGGVARMEDISKYGGWREGCIALTGPLVSGSIAGACALFGGEEVFFSLCVKYNLLLMGFNLIPALPMDGGRILRNILIIFMGYKQATRLAVLSGRLLAIFMAAYNIYSLLQGGTNATLLITAVFIYAGTIKEMRYCSYYYLLHRNNRKSHLTKNHKIKKRTIRVHEDTYIRSAANQFSPANLCRIEVFDDSGNTMRTLKEADIMDGFLKYGFDGKIKDVIK